MSASNGGRRAIDRASQSAAGDSTYGNVHTIAASGYYGCGNAGDEAVLAGIIEAFRRTAGDAVRLVALSQDPMATRALHGVGAEPRMDMQAVKSTLLRSDLLISGGGSLLQDTTSLRSLLYYLWVARMALNLRRPVMFYAQGLGPLRRRMARWLVRSIANRVEYITVRDEPSARLLRSIGVSKPPIEVTADPAFALQPAPEEAIAACWRSDIEHPERKHRVGVSLRPWGDNASAHAEHCATMVRAIEERTGCEIVLIPMQVPGDLTFSNDVARTAGRPYSIANNLCTPAALLGLVGQMDVVVAMRLHALIFAARMGVPPFALAYDPKVESLMRSLELAESVAPWTGFSASDVAEQVGTMLSERASRSADLLRRARSLERLALRNAEIAYSIVAGRRVV